MGGAEDESVQSVPVAPEGTVLASSPIRNFLNGLADIFNNITLMACINVNPFPSMLQESGYSTATNIFTTPGGPSAEKERMVASTIGAIFISCIIAEILYIAVFKCFLLGEAAIVKQVASVFLRGMMLFFIVINLPVIIELTRSGLQEIAYTIAGARVSESASLGEMRDNVFEDGAELGIKSLTGALVQVLYWIVQLICVICLCVASLHVMFNIVEVYLLIGIVSILAPFQIFDPTRWLGDHAINSLFVNLIELFILMVILYSCFAVLEVFQKWVNETFINQMKTGEPVSYEIGFNELMPESDYDLLVQLAEENGISGLPSYTQYESDFNARRSHSGNYQRSREKITEAMDEIHLKLAAKALSYGSVSANPADGDLVTEMANGDLLWDVTAINKAKDDGTLLSKLSIPTQIKVNTEVLADSPLLAKYGVAMAQYNVNTDIVPVHLSASLITVLMLFYFVGQSSQITNALIAGTAATTGFEGGMMKMGAAKGIGMAGTLAGGGVKVAGLASRGVVGGIKGVVNTGKTASQHVTNMASTSP